MKRNRSRINIKSKGFGILGWLLMVPVAVVVLLLLAIGFYEGRKAYWDYKVREMCDKHGGVTVYERVKISKKDFQGLWDQRIPPTENTRMDSPYFWQRIETTIRDSYPKVARAETLIKRRTDDKVLGKSVRYWRTGGDFPTGFSEATSFVCPQHADLIEQIFLVKEESR
jgi:hypothetical protein